ncbi:LEA type 2 family protein [Vulcaniibacterium tengchongense]|nr:LEA type 2 family protein [Vulcaniibacterium tengchongense]
MRLLRWTAWALCAVLLAACASGPVRRVSEPSARIQQLTVQADGRWSTELRIENFSSVPMRFDRIDLALRIGDADAGRLAAQPALSVAPESADVVTVVFAPQLAAKLAVADALAAGRSVNYTLAGSVDATPEEAKPRSFEIERNSALSPAPGLPGVMR